jgi:hypothetical protein
VEEKSLGVNCSGYEVDGISSPSTGEVPPEAAESLAKCPAGFMLGQCFETGELHNEGNCVGRNTGSLQLPQRSRRLLGQSGNCATKHKLCQGLQEVVEEAGMEGSCSQQCSLG